MYNIPMIENLIERHTLIAGTTGSGKSVLLNDVIMHISSQDPRTHKIILIDPKRLSFIDWDGLPHIIRFSDDKIAATEPDEITDTLNICVDIMEDRYKVMTENKIKELHDNPIYIIMDEIANIMLDKRNEEPIYRLVTLARACDMHVIMATQNPSRKVLDGKIQCCMEGCRVGLHCDDKESRMIIGKKGCEDLPAYGYGLVKRNGTIEKISIPFLTDEQIQEQVQEWAVTMAIKKSF